VVLKSLEICGWILSQHISDLCFILIWDPEVSNVGSLGESQVVKTVVESLFLCYKPLVDLE
jgi:hypothetical protein